MNNSTGFFESIWMYIWNIIKCSGIYKIARKIYDGISSAWQNSRIAGWFRRTNFSEDILSNCFIGKIFRFPFTILEIIAKKHGPAMRDIVDNSGILAVGRVYTHNLLAINLRFLGVLFVALGVGLIGGSLVSGGTVGLLKIGIIVLGIILAIFDVNIADWLKGSALIKVIVSGLGAETDFNWYSNELTCGKVRLIIAVIAGLVFGIAGGITVPVLGLLAIFGVGAVCLIFEKPLAGLFMLVFLAPLAPTMAMAGLSILCILALIIKSLRDEEFKWRYDGIGFLILLFIAIYLFAAITSFAMVKSLSIWAIYTVFLAAYFLIINLVKTKKQLNNLLITFVLSGLLVCLYGIAQYVFGWDTKQAWMDEEMFTDIKMRIYSTLGNPNVLGEYILLVLPVAIGMMFTKKGVFSKIVYAGISAVLFGALILTFSRGCWLGLMASAAIFVTFAAGKLWGLAVIALPFLPMILPESIINRFTSIGDMKDSSTSYRVYIWMGTLAMIKDFWVSGIGMGQEAFTEIYPFYSYNGIVAPHSHNLFLQILVESGICGIIVFLAIVLLFIKKMTTGYQFGGRKGGELSTMIVAVSSGVCGFLLQGMFDNCFYNYRVLLVFWCVIGIAMACTYVAKDLYSKEVA